MYSRCEKCGGEVTDVSLSDISKIVLCPKCDSTTEVFDSLPPGLVIDMDEERKK